jgi:hypothetical protein
MNQNSRHDETNVTKISKDVNDVRLKIDFANGFFFLISPILFI